jgi:hypothetical protein
MEMTTAEDYLDSLLRQNQLDLAALDRDRLEAILRGLLAGQIAVFTALGAETRQSTMIRNQGAVIENMTAAVSRANAMATEADVATVQHNPYQELLVTLAHIIPESLHANRPACVEQMLTAVYRGLEQAAEEGELIEDGVLVWWRDAAQRGFQSPEAGAAAAAVVQEASAPEPAAAEEPAGEPAQAAPEASPAPPAEDDTPEPEPVAESEQAEAEPEPTAEPEPEEQSDVEG